MPRGPSKRRRSKPIYVPHLPNSFVVFGPSTFICPYCVKTLEILVKQKKKFEYYKVNHLETLFFPMDKKIMRFDRHTQDKHFTYPQIYIRLNDELMYLGGLTELKYFLNIK